jgi:uncharacterized protein YybS (DUF2232 family)
MLVTNTLLQSVFLLIIVSFVLKQIYITKYIEYNFQFLKGFNLQIHVDCVSPSSFFLFQPKKENGKS